MPTASAALTPGLASFLKSLSGNSVESSIDQFISLLKRRQIRNSRPCAIATARLLLKVVCEFRGRDVGKLLHRIKDVGQRLTAAQPREMVVGNIVRRVLGLVREVAEDRNEEDLAAASESGYGTPQELTLGSRQRPSLSPHMSTFSPLRHGVAQPLDLSVQDSESLADSTGSLSRPTLQNSSTSFAASTPMVTSLFGLFSNADESSPSGTPIGQRSPTFRPAYTPQDSLRPSEPSRKDDLKDDVLQGILEILDEVEQVDTQIASYALDHIHSNEIILTHAASITVQNFLLKAASKRRFTVVHAEAYPNENNDTHTVILKGKTKAAEELAGEDDRFKPLTAAGITVVLIPDSAVFAIMSRVNKVILATHTVLANGGLVATAGARMIARAAKMHQTPVVVLSGVYKLSPVYPFNVDELIEFGDAGQVADYADGDFVDKVDVVNPLYDYVPADLIDLYITNLGGHAPSYLYRIVADHYRAEDISLLDS